MRPRLKVFLVVASLLVLGLVAASVGAARRRLRDGATIEIHRPESVVALAFSPSGDLLLSLEGDASHYQRTVHTSSEPSGASLGTFSVEEGLYDGGGVDLAVSPGNLFAVSRDSGEVLLHALPRGERVDRLATGGGWGHEVSGPYNVRFSPTGRLVAAYGRGGWGHVWDVSRRSLEWSSECCGVLGLVSDDAVAFAASSSVLVQSLSTRSVLTVIPLDPDVVNWCHALSPRGKIAVSYPWEGNFKASFRSLPSGEPIGEPLTIDPHMKIAFSADDALVAVVGPETVSILEVATGRSVFFTSFPRRVDASSVVFSPTRDRLAVARDGTIHVFVFRR
jgi:WD40 repeat protein